MFRTRFREVETSFLYIDWVTFGRLYNILLLGQVFLFASSPIHMFSFVPVHAVVSPIPYDGDMELTTLYEEYEPTH